VIVSGEVGLAKPDPAIFELAAPGFGVTPATDPVRGRLAAQHRRGGRLGFATHHFTEAASLREDLQDRGGC
jgi:2-haloacid dehalogenase